jgi:hypothetical protein
MTSHLQLNGYSGLLALIGLGFISQDVVQQG